MLNWNEARKVKGISLGCCCCEGSLVMGFLIVMNRKYFH